MDVRSKIVNSFCMSYYHWILFLLSVVNKKTRLFLNGA